MIKFSRDIGWTHLFCLRARAPAPPNFFGSIRRGSAIRSVLSYATSFFFSSIALNASTYASNEHGLVDFKSQNLRLNKVDGRPVNANQAFAFTRMCDRSRGLEGNRVYIWACRGIIAPRTFFFPKVCTALVVDAIL